MHHFAFIYIMVFFAVFRFGDIPKKAKKLEEQLAKMETTSKKDQWVLIGN